MIKAKKQFGQNFMVDQNILNKIIDSVSFDLPILEIGSGTGLLTQKLTENTELPIISYEIDRDLFPETKKKLELFNNVTLVNQDFMASEIPNIDLCVIANIPYHLTSPIIDKLLNRRNVKDIYLMVQKEIADRICSKESKSNYSSFSIFCQTRAEVKTLFNVSKNSFVPKPKIDSAFIQLKPFNKYLNQIENLEVYNNIIRAAFWGKRKTLFNCLAKSPYTNFSKEIVIKTYEKLNILQTIRGQQMPVPEFIKLANELFRWTNHNKLS